MFEAKVEDSRAVLRAAGGRWFWARSVS